MPGGRQQKPLYRAHARTAMELEPTTKNILTDTNANEVWHGIWHIRDVVHFAGQLTTLEQAEVIPMFALSEIVNY